MHINFELIMDWVIQYKYWIIFPLVVIEGPMVTIISGLLASLGYLNFFIAFPVIFAADITSDSIYYFLGRWGRDRFHKKNNSFIGIKSRQIVKLERHFEKHGGKTLIIGKYMHLFIIPIMISAGMAKIRYLKFLFFVLIGNLPKSLILILVGFYFGSGYLIIKHYLDISSAVTIVTVLFISLAYLIYKIFLKNEKLINKQFKKLWE